MGQSPANVRDHVVLLQNLILFCPVSKGTNQETNAIHFPLLSSVHLFTVNYLHFFLMSVLEDSFTFTSITHSVFIFTHTASHI